MDLPAGSKRNVKDVNRLLMIKRGKFYEFYINGRKAGVENFAEFDINDPIGFQLFGESSVSVKYITVTQN